MGRLESEKASFDRLPKVLMTARALKHFRLRNPREDALRFVVAQDGPLSKDKHEFASNGGPRLRWMHGNTTVYDANFELYLQQQGIFRDFIGFPSGEQTPELMNRQDINKRLFEKRNDELAPGLDDERFDDFETVNSTPSIDDWIWSVIPKMIGPQADEAVYAADFNNLEPIGDIAFVEPSPDVFDGAAHGDLDNDVCNELRHRIIPSTFGRRSKIRSRVVPNWFVEARIHSANTDTCIRELCHTSAYGAHAVHALQNYGRSPDDKIYDGNAYTYSAMYVVESRRLEIFAHYMAKAANGQEQYHMTKLCEFNMTESKASFQKGISAFRNARGLAKEYRDAFIKEANDRAAKKRSRAADEQRRLELARLETVQEEVDDSHPSKVESSSLQEAPLQKGEDVLKRVRPEDVVGGDEEALCPKRKKADDC